MIIKDDCFIVKGRKFKPSEVEQILINHIETGNEEKIKLKQFEYEGEPLVEFCKRVWLHDRNTVDNFYTLLIKRPYTYKGMKKGLVRNCFSDVTVTSVLKELAMWKDYIIKSVHYGTDCSITVTAELVCNTVNDLIYYCKDDINKNCIFKEIFTANNTYDLDYVKTFGEQFEDTVFVKEVDVDNDKKIIKVYYMKNGGKDNA